MAKILLVDDDISLCLTMSTLFSEEGHLVDEAHTVASAWDFLSTYSYDLIVLDWELPDGSGVELIVKIRQSGGLTPLLMLTGRTALDDKERGLDAGADDYLTKPFQERELLARMRALMRRPATLMNEELKVKNISLNTLTRKLLLEGKELKLQPMEFSVLEFFMRNQAAVFSPEEIIQRIWGSDSDVSLDAVYSCIKRLRKKLGGDGKGSIIRNVHGVGYQLIAD